MSFCLIDSQRVENLFDGILAQTKDVDPKGFTNNIEEEWPEISVFEPNGNFERTGYDKEAIEDGMIASGMEVLAFYKSYRYRHCPPAKGLWGIFIWDEGIKYLADEMKKYGVPYYDYEQLALDFLHAHEFYHFKADVQALHLAQIANRPLYTILNRAIGKKGCLFVEESLANQAVMTWTRTQKVPQLGKFAHNFITTKQIGAYVDIDSKHVEQQRLQWMSDFLEGQLNTKNLHHGTEGWQALLPRFINKKSCPCYIFNTNTQAWLQHRMLRVGGYQVHEIVDEEKIKKIMNREPIWNKWWEQTKAKLLQNAHFSSVKFNHWPDGEVGVHKKHKVFSARAKGMRAHLWLADRLKCRWMTYEFADHNASGHGK